MTNFVLEAIQERNIQIEEGQSMKDINKHYHVPRNQKKQQQPIEERKDNPPECAGLSR
jgi:hypothetical protein